MNSPKHLFDTPAAETILETEKLIYSANGAVAAGTKRSYPLSLTTGLELVRICQNCQGCPNADHSFGRVDLVRLAKNWQGWTWL